MPEKRFHLRVPLDVPVVITGRRRVDARATGLSCGGMTVLGEGLEPGEDVSLAMNLPRASAPVLLSARVAHIRGQVVGLAFTTVHANDAQIIEQFVWQSLSPPEKEPPPGGELGRPGVSLKVPLDVRVGLRRRSGLVEARATGLSPGGLAVRGVELDQGEEVVVELDLPGAKAPVRASGLVAHRGRGIAGIRFVGLSAQELRELENTLWNYLRQAIRGTAQVEVRSELPVQRMADRTENILLSIDEAAVTKSQDDGKRNCEIPGCARPHKARGLCTLHYNRWRRRPR